MNDNKLILKLNGLICLFLGACLVFIPKQLSAFLSTTDPAPEVVPLLTGMFLNIFGMLTLWLANQAQPQPKLSGLVVFLDLLWTLFILGLIVSKTWITSTNGTTTAGLSAILLGWLGWSLWLQLRKTD